MPVTNTFVIPSHILLSNIDVKLTIIIDCPPALSWLTINAFTASDRVLIPVAPGYFELDSIVQISKTTQKIEHG